MQMQGQGQMQPQMAQMQGQQMQINRQQQMINQQRMVQQQQQRMAMQQRPQQVIVQRAGPTVLGPGQLLGNGGFIDPRAAQSGMVRTGGMISNSPASNMVKNAPLMAGWMNKEGGVFKSWKKRFFKLTNTSLTYYDGNPGRVKGTFQIKWVTHVSNTSSKAGHPHAFEVTVKIPKRRTYVFEASNAAEKQQWLQALHTLTGGR